MKKRRKRRGAPSKIEKLNKTIVKKLYLDGKTDKQVAEFIGVSEVTLNTWKAKYPKLLMSIKDWKQKADEDVETSLYERACGVTVKEKHTEGVEIKTPDGKIVPASKVKTIEREIPADPTSMIFWLKNRKPKDWRDKKEVEVTTLTPEEKAETVNRVTELLRSRDN